MPAGQPAQEGEPQEPRGGAALTFFILKDSSSSLSTARMFSMGMLHRGCSPARKGHDSGREAPALGGRGGHRRTAGFPQQDLGLPPGNPDLPATCLLEEPCPHILLPSAVSPRPMAPQTQRTRPTQDPDSHAGSPGAQAHLFPTPTQATWQADVSHALLGPETAHARDTYSTCFVSSRKAGRNPSVPQSRLWPLRINYGTPVKSQFLLLPLLLW